MEMKAKISLNLGEILAYIYFEKRRIITETTTHEKHFQVKSN